MTLKTKLRLAILGLVLVIALVYSWLYISLLTRKEFEAAWDLAIYVRKEIGQKVNQALEESKLAVPALGSNADVTAAPALVKRAIAVHPGLISLLESIPAYSYTLAYAQVVDADGVIIAHSDSDQVGNRAERRYSFEPLINAGVLEQLRAAFGPEQVYEVSGGMDLTITETVSGKRTEENYPLATVRVGVSTVFLRNALTPQLKSAAWLVAAAVAVALIFGWLATAILLRPLASLNVSLDLMTKGQFDAVPAGPKSPDEFGAVASKLTLLGQQFRDVRESMAQLLHGLEEALLLFTRDGRAILASDRVQEFLNLQPGEVVGLYVEDIFTSHPDIAVMVSQAIRQGLPFLRREVELQGNRRVAISVQFITGLAPDDGTSEGGESSAPAGAALVSLRDAESVRRLESQIEMSNRLAAISRLTSGVAHEVRNPLNAIVLHVEALKAKLKTPDPGVAEHLEIMAREIYRLDRVVRTFLDFTRPVRLNLQETDLDALLQEVVGLASAEADTRKVHVTFQPNGIRPMVRVDRDLIKQAILNVVLNGCQAMPDGGQLAVTERIAEGLVEIEIADQGPGIAVDIADKIFDLYFTTREKGSGIGLPLAFRAFQLHNGTVEFHNRKEGGAVFEMRLPLASAEGSSA